MSSKVMEAFLEAQTRFLEQQQKFAEQEETRKMEIHLAQVKELEGRVRLLKLQEEQSEEARTKREASEKKKQQMKQAENLEKWHDGYQPDAYLAKFETIMTECDIPKEQWRGCLVNCLTGRALTAYRSVIQGGEDMDYDKLKDKLLEAMGLGIADQEPNKRMIDSPLDMLRQLDSSYSRITRDCSTPAQLRQEMVIGRLLSLYPTDILLITFTSGIRPTPTSSAVFAKLSRQPPIEEKEPWFKGGEWLWEGYGP
jgi:hypothetical protein